MCGGGCTLISIRNIVVYGWCYILSGLGWYQPILHLKPWVLHTGAVGNHSQVFLLAFRHYKLRQRQYRGSQRLKALSEKLIGASMIDGKFNEITYMRAHFILAVRVSFTQTQKLPPSDEVSYKHSENFSSLSQLNFLWCVLKIISDRVHQTNWHLCRGYLLIHIFHFSQKVKEAAPGLDPLYA